MKGSLVKAATEKNMPDPKQNACENFIDSQA